jgi:hypothetical protein
MVIGSSELMSKGLGRPSSDLHPPISFHMGVKKVYSNHPHTSGKKY